MSSFSEHSKNTVLKKLRQLTKETRSESQLAALDRVLEKAEDMDLAGTTEFEEAYNVHVRISELPEGGTLTDSEEISNSSDENEEGTYNLLWPNTLLEGSQHSSMHYLLAACS